MDRAVFAVFGEDHVRRLTGLSLKQLRYWRKSGFFVPTAAEAVFGPFYSFRDVVSLRTLRLLRHEHQVSLQHLRKVASQLSHLGQSVWRSATLYLLGRRVVVHEPGTAMPLEMVAGQYTLDIPLRKIAKEISTDAGRLLGRAPGKIGQVGRTGGILGGAVAFLGTRIPIRSVWRFLDAGFSTAAILAEYPDLTETDVEAAIAARAGQVAA